MTPLRIRRQTDAIAASVGGLFFMAGDNNGPADGGSAGKNTEVEIESLTIELNLSAPGTFGANNNAAVGGLFTVSSGVSAAMGGKYVSGARRRLLWLTTSVPLEL